MRIITSVLPLILVLPTFTACSKSSKKGEGGGPPLPEPGPFTVRAIDDATYLPLADAWVRIGVKGGSTAAAAESRTDAEGKAAFPAELREQGESITAFREGYVPKTVYGWLISDPQIGLEREGPPVGGPANATVIRGTVTGFSDDFDSDKYDTRIRVAVSTDNPVRSVISGEAAYQTILPGAEFEIRVSPGTMALYAYQELQEAMLPVGEQRRARSRVHTAMNFEGAPRRLEPEYRSLKLRFGVVRGIEVKEGAKEIRQDIALNREYAVDVEAPDRGKPSKQEPREWFFGLKLVPEGYVILDRSRKPAGPDAKPDPYQTLKIPDFSDEDGADYFSVRLFKVGKGLSAVSGAGSTPEDAVRWKEPLASPTAKFVKGNLPSGEMGWDSQGNIMMAMFQEIEIPPQGLDYASPVRTVYQVQFATPRKSIVFPPTPEGFLPLFESGKQYAVNLMAVEFSEEQQGALTQLAEAKPNTDPDQVSDPVNPPANHPTPALFGRIASGYSGPFAIP